MQVNGERLWQRLMDMAAIAPTEKGGNNRQALTDEDVAGRKLFIKWAEAAGCSVRLDEIGNIFVRKEGLNPHAPVVLTGSHLDTQPTGGRFDGIYGVLAGLEAIETMHEQGIETEHPIEIAVWCNEEGSRFPSSMMGSAVWSGVMPLSTALELRDIQGISVGEELRRTGQRGDLEAVPFPIKAAYELHIEQGPILENAEDIIGVVTGVQNMSRQQFVITGQEAHAGPTPMALRRDPMRALGDFLPRLYAMCAHNGEDAKITFGEIRAEPGSGNTIPGRLVMTCDLRHPDRMIYEGMVNAAYDIVRKACADANVDIEIEELFHAPGVTFDETCVSIVHKAAKASGYPYRLMSSGAGHDACNVASVAPTAMIFIPCRDGISHNEAEYAEPAHVEAGANVLLSVLLESSLVN
ncbi:MAG: Zn-dependent hydrolase [Hyphomonas sp.]|nr:Zn-dependent hydrolase [Hyphomonas sp.]